MKNNTLPLALAMLGCGLIIGILTGVYVTNGDWQKDAEARGHAEYYLDENHKAQWRWIRTKDKRDSSND